MLLISLSLLLITVSVSGMCLGRRLPFIGPPFETWGRFILQCLLSAVFCVVTVGIIMVSQLEFSDAVRGTPTERIWWLDVLAAPLLETLLFQTLVVKFFELHPVKPFGKRELFVILAILFAGLHVIVLGWAVGLAVGITGGVVFSSLFVMYLPSHPRAFLASSLTHIFYNSMVLSLGSI